MPNKKKDENIQTKDAGLTLDQIRGLHHILDIRVGVIANYAAYYSFVAYEVGERDDDGD